MIYPMAVIHISEEEAARDLRAVLAKVRAGELVEIDSGGESFTLLPSRYEVPKTRTLSEAIRSSRERNEKVVLDDRFGDDLENVIRQHENEHLGSSWE
jgi:hypothetical protein